MTPKQVEHMVGSPEPPLSIKVNDTISRSKVMTLLALLVLRPVHIILSSVSAVAVIRKGSHHDLQGPMALYRTKQGLLEQPPVAQGLAALSAISAPPGFRAQIMHGITSAACTVRCDSPMSSTHR